MISPRLYHGRTKREVNFNITLILHIISEKICTSEIPSNYSHLKCPLFQVQSSHSKEEEGGHAHHLTVAWFDDKTGKDIVVDLNLNRDLIPESYAERYHHQVNIIELECESLSRYVEGRVHKLCTYDVSMKECHEMVESGYLVFF